MRILFFDLDTLRPDHLGCYGYHRDTSPNIDRIAREGVMFRNYYCPDAPCLPSRAALMSGRFGIHTGVVGHGGTAADMRIEGAGRGFADIAFRENMVRIFREAGLRTVTVSPFAERHGAWWFLANFNEAYNLAGKQGNESAEDVTPVVLDWIDRNGADDNWFLHVNYWDAHAPYRAPEAFGNPFENDPIPAWFTQDVIERHLEHVGPNSAREMNMYDSKPNAWPWAPRHVAEIRDMDDVHRHIDGYDCGIAFMDSHIGQIFAALEDKGVMDDLAVIITADHGENQGELGIYKEHGTADQITCNVPMIIRWPGGKRGHVDEGLHYNLDLAPTLAELLGRPPKPSWDGRSYASTLLEGADCGRDYLVVSQCAHVCQRSVRFGPWLYMRTYHDGYHLFPDEMLYNIEDDPHEQNDLAGERPDICQEAARLLGKWHGEMMATMPNATDPLWTVMQEGGPFHARGHLPAYCERLERTDRAWAVEELKKRHPAEFA